MCSRFKSPLRHEPLRSGGELRCRRLLARCIAWEAAAVDVAALVIAGDLGPIVECRATLDPVRPEDQRASILAACAPTLKHRTRGENGFTTDHFDPALVAF